MMMESHLFLGVLISWGVAALSTLLVAIFARKIKKVEDYKNAYKLISTRYEKWFCGITAFVLLYLAFHLSSKGLTGTGIPKVSENYTRLWGLSGTGFWANVSPQEIFLCSFAILLIFFIFSVAPRLIAKPPRFIAKYKNKDKYIVIGCFASSFLIALGVAWGCYVLCRPAELITTAALTTPISSLNIQARESLTFFTGFVISFIIFLVFYFRMKSPEEVREDFMNLLFAFCVIPAIILGPLALARDKLIIFPNIGGHAVVGLFFISGFLTLMFLTTMFLKPEIDMKGVWLCLIFASLAAISLSCSLFLFLKPWFIGIDNLGQLLLLPIAFMLIVLPYTLYERMWRYRFGEWWIRKWRPYAMIFSIVLIIIISPLEPTIWKLAIIIFSAIFAFFIPYLCSVGEFGLKFEGLKLPRFRLPKYLGGVLIKIRPGMSKEARDNISMIRGVYQTMVVTGPFEVYAIIEAIDAEDFRNKICEIGKKEGVTQTITLKDITEVIERG